MNTADIELDFARRQRIGLDEAVFAHGKTAAQIEAILGLAGARNVPLLITRLEERKLRRIDASWARQIDYCPLSRTGFFGEPPRTGRPQHASAARVPGAAAPGVAIVAAGTSDAGVAREAERTLSFNGVASTVFVDVGVAGLWRLTNRLEALRRHPVIIAVAGMDAALPTVLGGLVSSLVIAVPTSVGYGVAAGGRAALNAILASCASGIVAVNIDNGYGAACAAMRMLNAMTAAGREARPAAADRPVHA